MGKWTLQATEEVLLAKIRTAVQDAIETHRNEKPQEGEARPVSFAEFVEELDAKDAFTARLMEILVKEYSERRAKATPVERRLQIASRTSKALGAIPRDATVYDNSRPARWPRTRFPSVLRRHLMDDDENFALPPPGDEDVTLSTSVNARDRLFQSALEELEDGEFGARWNSNVNEAYTDEGDQALWQRSEAIRPTLYDVDMGGWHVATDRDDLGISAARSTSPSSFGSEMDSLAQNQEAFSRLRFRPGSLSDSLGHRLGSPRLPLVRRHSLRRSRFGRSPSMLDLDAAFRRRLARAEGEDADGGMDRLGEDLLSRGPSWRTPSRRTGGNFPEELGILRPEPTPPSGTGATLRRIWTDYPFGGASSAASGSNTTLPGRRGLRRGGLRPPETLMGSSLLALANSAYTSTLRPGADLNRPASASRAPASQAELLPLLPPSDLSDPWASAFRTPRPGTPTQWTPTIGLHARTAPASPTTGDLSHIRVRWTEDLVNFSITSAAAEHESVSAYPEMALPTVLDSSIPEDRTPTSHLPQPGPSTQ